MSYSQVDRLTVLKASTEKYNAVQRTIASFEKEVNEAREKLVKKEMVKKWWRRDRTRDQAFKIVLMNESSVHNHWGNMHLYDRRKAHRKLSNKWHSFMLMCGLSKSETIYLSREDSKLLFG